MPFTGQTLASTCPSPPPPQTRLYYAWQKIPKNVLLEKDSVWFSPKLFYRNSGHWSFGRIMLFESFSYLLWIWLSAYRGTIIWLKFGFPCRFAYKEGMCWMGQQCHYSPKLWLHWNFQFFQSLSLFLCCFAPHPTWNSRIIPKFWLATCQCSKVPCFSVFSSSSHDEITTLDEF